MTRANNRDIEPLGALKGAIIRNRGPGTLEKQVLCNLKAALFVLRTLAKAVGLFAGRPFPPWSEFTVLHYPTSLYVYISFGWKMLRDHYLIQKLRSSK